MERLSMLRNEAAAELFLTFAEFYKPLTESFFQEIKSGDMDKKLQLLFQAAGYAAPLGKLGFNLQGFTNLKQLYSDCFSDPVGHIVPPIESLYKPWTTDPSASLLHEKSKGYLFGDAALHMQYLFGQYRLAIPKEYTNMPDHLTLLLEFLAYLVRNEASELTYQFILDHLDWLAAFKQELKAIKDSTFYLNITALCMHAIDEEKAILQKSNDTKSNLQFQQDSLFNTVRGSCYHPRNKGG